MPLSATLWDNLLQKRLFCNDVLPVWVRAPPKDAGRGKKESRESKVLQCKIESFVKSPLLGHKNYEMVAL
jgi:hypothetical protein